MIDDIISKYQLNKKQEKFMRLANLKHNIFLFGKAGTGKSHVIKALKEFMGSKLAITASTGVAALNIQGSTFHSFLGVGKMNAPINYTVNQILKNPELVDTLKKVQCLLIDEISMFSNKPFFYLDHILRKVKNDSRICGGTQIIVVGDYMQLPYVNNEKAAHFDKSGIIQEPAYNCVVWGELNFKPISLTEIMRQKGDQSFIDILNQARNGIYTPELYALRTSNRIDKTSILEKDFDHIIITSENKTVSEINEYKYNKLPGPEYTYNAVIVKGDKNADYACGQFDRVKSEIKLKVGTRVIVEHNIDINRGLVNGTRGIITDFVNGLPVMKYANDQIYHVEPYDFKSRIYNENTKTNEVVLHVKQLPLSLSYAITVNRSQGLTFDKVIIDIGNEGLYHKGKIYTALSRCKSANGLLFYNFPNRQKNSQGLNFAIDEEAKLFLDHQDLICDIN